MKYKQLLISASLAGFVVACGGGSSGPAATTPVTVEVSGSVSAINGAITFYAPSVTDTLLAGLFGKPAFSAITGETSVGAGVTINLIEVDADGLQVGDVIATTITLADGSYSLDAPESFAANPKYCVRAVGTSVNSDARVDSLTPSISPTSDAVSAVIAANSLDLTKLSAAEVAEIQAAVADVVENTDAATGTVVAFRDDILAATATDEAASNLVASTVAAGEICGSITDSDGTGLGNIRIVVRDFGNWTTRAKTKTASDGSYCVNVPRAGDADTYISGKTLSGDYILGALNFTGSSFAASQWWTSTSNAVGGSGGTNIQFDAEKISLASDATTITRDMVLDKNGARIVGTVTGPNGATVEGMRVVIRNYDVIKPLASARVKADGSYRINVKAADYLLSFRNKTRHPYASEIYDGGTGAFNRNLGSRVTMVANQDNTYDAELAAGAVISGIVKDNAGTAVSGEVLFVDNADGGRIEALRTNKAGKFRIWVNPRLGSGLATPYIVRTRGQAIGADTNGDGSTTTHFKLSASTGLVFDAQTTKISGKLVSADGTPAPVSSAVVFLTNSNKDKAVSAADGSFSLYTETATAGTHNFTIRLDNDVDYASGAYDGTSSITRTGRNTAAIDATGGDVDLGNLTVQTLGINAGVGYVNGNAGAGSTLVKIFTGTPATNTFMVGTNSRGDGSFNVTVPAGSYVFRSDVNTGGTCSITVTNGAITTLTFDGTITPPC